MADLALRSLPVTRLPRGSALAPASRNSEAHDQSPSKTVVPSRTGHHPGCAIHYSSHEPCAAMCCAFMCYNLVPTVMYQECGTLIGLWCLEVRPLEIILDKVIGMEPL